MNMVLNVHDSNLVQIYLGLDEARYTINMNFCY